MRTHRGRTTVVDIAVANMPADHRNSAGLEARTLVTMQFQTVS
jgi:hypothetical protein